MQISLALGGGGAKGNAHLGVLKVLEREGFSIEALAGTSAGGLVGAVYLAGHSPDEILDQLAGLDQGKFFGHRPGDQPSLLGFGGMTEILTDVLGEITFADLPIPFAVTAVDLHTGQPVVISEGRLLDAVLATVAVPGILPAREWGDYLLIDGSTINPVPVNVVRPLAPNVPVVAVVLTQPVQPDRDLPGAGLTSSLPVLERITRMRMAQAFSVFTRAIDISSRLLVDLRLEIDQPEVVIRPLVDDINLFDEVDVQAVAALGEQAALAHLPEIQQAVRWQNRLLRRFQLNN